MNPNRPTQAVTPAEFKPKQDKKEEKRT